MEDWLRGGIQASEREVGKEGMEETKRDWQQHFIGISGSGMVATHLCQW